MLLRGTWIILKFVKDKTNLLNHNQWSCCRYLNNITGFTLYGTTIATPTENYLIVTNSSSNAYTQIYFNHELTSEDWGKTITLTANIRAVNTHITQQFSIDGKWAAGVTVNISDDFQKVILTKQVPENSQILKVNWAVTGEEDLIHEFFLESISLNIQ